MPNADESEVIWLRRDLTGVIHYEYASGLPCTWSPYCEPGAVYINMIDDRFPSGKVTVTCMACVASGRKL